ncbi:hypothetical protein GEMRC1_008513 [Eukaryota sp. GEM-RC1]
MSNCHSQIDECQQKIRTLEENLKKTQSLLDLASKERESMISRHESEVKQLQDSITRFSQQLKFSEKTLQNLKSSKPSSSADLAVLSAEHDNVKQQLERSQQRCQLMESKCNTLESYVGKLKIMLQNRS